MEVSKIVPRIQKNLRYYKNPIKGIYRRFKYGKPISIHEDNSILYKKNVKLSGEDGTERNLIDTKGNITRQIRMRKGRNLKGYIIGILRSDVKNIKKEFKNVLSGNFYGTSYEVKKWGAKRDYIMNWDNGSKYYKDKRDEDWISLSDPNRIHRQLELGHDWVKETDECRNCQDPVIKSRLSHK